MPRLAILFGFLFILGLHANAAGWTLGSAKIKYQVHHPLHTVDGVSDAAKGKGQCAKDECEFLIAAPIKSFDSGNSNRDVHMREIVNASLHPMVLVRGKLKADQIKNGVAEAPLTFELNGVSVTQKTPLNFSLTMDGAEVRGSTTLKLEEFKIERPSLLGVKVDDNFKLEFTSSWRKN
jgi:hypothetical protein